jgi:hypothetical protein
MKRHLLGVLHATLEELLPPMLLTGEMSTVITEFVVEAEGELRVAQCAFATMRDLDEIKSWPKQVKGAQDSVTQDALEFASLSSKRWRFYHEVGRTAASIGSMKRKLAAANNTELAVLCVAKAQWVKKRTLGLALFRRTWCNHLVLDFLATHPLRLMDGPARMQGIGKGLLYGIAEVAHALRSAVLWGEATETSAPIYKRIFQLKNVDDLLLVPAANLDALRKTMRMQLETSGLRQK